jgi:hypothetical protein
VGENVGWKINHYGPGDKMICLVGPSDGFYPQRIYVEFDDVNREEVERRLPLIAEALDSLNLQPPS